MKDDEVILYFLYINTLIFLLFGLWKFLQMQRQTCNLKKAGLSRVDSRPPEDFLLLWFGRRDAVTAYFCPLEFVINIAIASHPYNPMQFNTM